MRLRRLTRAVATLLASTCLFALPVGATEAAPKCIQVDLVTGVCIISIEAPAAPSTIEQVSGEGPADTGPDLPCWQDLSSFTRLDPQPDASDPVWAGRDPADGGAIYHCYFPLSPPLLTIDIFIWLPSPPEASGSGPSPREVAEMAIDQMNLRAITIGIVPEPGPGSIGLVGMPVWMWAAEPGPSTVGPITASASAGGITVTATARIDQITWDMGDGQTVVCRGPGTAYNASYGRAQSPDCGHVYTTSSAGKPGDRFTVTANSDWVIAWEGAGQTGTIRMDGLTESVQVAVGEAQVLVSS